ncbi:13753_t:CDS:2 [Funneliformis caledonium]|uniref:13753_t:CDS:1 n=1 Tax=Funneliformis caledonium TaxID=1117310 RepID=A0A9N8VU38_9GLOM|nr:13753_t:CDS:2 [Funneliformis caledonium]
MSHRTELTSQDKGKILVYMENFNPAQIARKMGRDPTTIRRIIDRYKKTGKTENLPRSGPLQLLKEHYMMLEFILMLLQKKPFISEKHALARISWCEKYKERTAYDWAQVIFSDESSVEIGKQSRQIRVWRHKGKV